MYIYTISASRQMRLFKKAFSELKSLLQPLNAEFCNTVECISLTQMQEKYPYISTIIYNTIRCSTNTGK